MGNYWVIIKTEQTRILTWTDILVSDWYILVTMNPDLVPLTLLAQ